MSTYEIYRGSKIGTCLTETLDEMVLSGTLNPEVAIQVLIQFDKCILEALKRQSENKYLIKGHLQTYRYYDDVWTFVLQDALLKMEESQQSIGRVKIVACDSTVLTQ